MRAFIALDLAPAVTRALAELPRRVRARAGLADRAIRWTSPEQLHLTLHFLGEVASERVRTLTDGLTRPWTQPAFRLRLGGGGVFPSRAAARVVWVGLEEGVEQVRAVVEESGRRVRAAGLELDARPYHAHVTVGRVRQMPRGRVATLVEAVADSSESPPWTVDRVVLYESRLGPAGAVYQRVAEGHLADPTRPATGAPGT